MSRAGGRWGEGLAFIDGNQTGLDGDEADLHAVYSVIEETWILSGAR